MPQSQVIPYSEQYQQQVESLVLGVQHEFGIPVSISDQPDLKNIPGFYQHDNGNFWIALAEGKVTGTIALMDIGNGRGALRKMFVDAAFRGKQHGTGQALLDALVEWAVAKELNELVLGTTAVFLAAHRFYEKNGFEEIAASALPDGFLRMDVDTKFYRKSL
jgi:GNAT superfamily N-acetyltransferase